MRSYRHAWLQVNVNVKGEDLQVLIDPTINQFKEDYWATAEDIAVWHKYTLGFLEAFGKYDPTDGYIQGEPTAKHIFNSLYPDV